jgi:hypothetical protein
MSANATYGPRRRVEGPRQLRISASFFPDSSIASQGSRYDSQTLRGGRRHEVVPRDFTSIVPPRACRHHLNVLHVLVKGAQGWQLDANFQSAKSRL